MICSSRQILFGGENQEEGDGYGLVACRGKGEICKGYWLAELREGDNLEDTDVEGRIIIKRIVKKCNGGMNFI